MVPPLTGTVILLGFFFLSFFPETDKEGILQTLVDDNLNEALNSKVIDPLEIYIYICIDR